MNKSPLCMGRLSPSVKTCGFATSLVSGRLIKLAPSDEGAGIAKQ